MRKARRRTRRRPLAGQTVLVTRPRGQAAELSSRLRALGARILEVPTIRIEDPPDRTPLLRALRRLSSYDWLVVTSVNGVERVERALGELGCSAEALKSVRVAAIGPATARRAAALGLRVDVVPGTYRAEALVEAVAAAARPETGGGAERAPAAGGTVDGSPGARPMEGQRVLLPRAAGARSVLPDGLRAAGARVDEVPAYVTAPAGERAVALRRVLETGAVDWITFTSSSSVRSFAELAGGETGGARVAAIGPVTAGTARELGFRVDVVAEEYTIPGLVRALAAAARPREGVE